MILLDASGLGAGRPGRRFFDGLDLTISDGQRLGVVGLNGCGKSTLLGILAGTVEPEAGHVRRGRGVEVAVLDQSPELHGATLAEALHHGAPGRAWELDAVADRLGLGGLGPLAVGALSGGQAKRVALARALVAEAQVLVLDEPTNHLDIDAVAWLEERLARLGGALVVVTHDRHFLDAVTNEVLELDRGEVHRHQGGYAAYLEGRARREELAGRREAARRNLARSELAWLRRGAPARTSKPKARIAAATQVVQARAAEPARAGDLPLHAAIPRLGDRVVELHDVAYRIGDRTLFEHVDLLVDRRERLGVLGPNGSGKSTLIDVMAGRLEPTAGRVEHGTTASIGVYDQHGRDLDASLRVREAMVGPHREPDWADAALLEAFWFDEDAQWAPVGLLSGGERRRLQLLVTLAARPNVLLLDEPTNDLDLDTLRQLEDFLESFAGAVIVVSHDRAFLERVVTDVVVLGDGALERRAGGYARYEQERRLRRRRGRAELDPPASPAAERPAARSADAPGSQRTADTAITAGPAAPTVKSPPSPSTLRNRLRAAERRLEQARGTEEVARSDMEQEAASGDHRRTAAAADALAGATEELASAEEAWLELAGEIEARGLEL